MDILSLSLVFFHSLKNYFYFFYSLIFVWFCTSLEGVFLSFDGWEVFTSWEGYWCLFLSLKYLFISVFVLFKIEFSFVVLISLSDVEVSFEVESSSVEFTVSFSLFISSYFFLFWVKVSLLLDGSRRIFFFNCYSSFVCLAFERYIL